MRRFLAVLLLLPWLAIADIPGPHPRTTATLDSTLPAALPTTLLAAVSGQTKSLQFDGAFSLNTPISTHVLGFTDTFSVAMWAKNEATVPVAADHLFTIRQSAGANNSIDFGFKDASNSDLRLNITNDGPTIIQLRDWTAASTVDVWSHYVLTYGGDAGEGANGVRLYLNGVLTASDAPIVNSAGSSFVDDGRQLRIGMHVLTNTRFIGPYYQFQIFDEVITQASVTTLYNGGAPQGVDPSTISGLINSYELGTGTSDDDFGEDRTGTLETDAGASTLDETDLTTDIPQ